MHRHVKKIIYSNQLTIKVGLINFVNVFFLFSCHNLGVAHIFFNIFTRAQTISWGEGVQDWWMLFKLKKKIIITFFYLYMLYNWHVDLLPHDKYWQTIWGTVSASRVPNWANSSSDVSPSPSQSALRWSGSQRCPRHSDTLQTNHACTHPPLILLWLTDLPHRAANLPGTFVIKNLKSNFVLNINVLGALSLLYRHVQQWVWSNSWSSRENTAARAHSLFVCLFVRIVFIDLINKQNGQ